MEKVKKHKKLMISIICILVLAILYIALNLIIVEVNSGGVKSSSSVSAGKSKGSERTSSAPMYDVRINHTGTLESGKIVICYVKELEETYNISELSEDNIIAKIVIDKPGDYDVTVELGDIDGDTMHRYMEVSSDFEGSYLHVKKYIKRPLIDVILNFIF